MAEDHPVADPHAFGGLIGVARRDITPPMGIYARNWGAATHDVAIGIHRPLSLTVLAIRTGPHDPPLILASVDASWWRNPTDEWLVRGPLLESLGLDSARVMLCLTHTHASPSISTDEADKPGGHLIADYVRHIRDSLVAAAKEAIGSAVSATLTCAYGRCDLATNRDLPTAAPSRLILGYNPDEPSDDTVLVGRVTRDTDSAIMATIVNYACHPTTLAWDNRLISPDFIGGMREVIEPATGGAPCLFLQGASGELAPRLQCTGNPEIADNNGRRLGHCATATLQGMLPPRQRMRFDGIVESGTALAVWSTQPFSPSATLEVREINVMLPLTTLPSEADLQAHIQSTTDRVQGERLLRKLRLVRHVGNGSTTTAPAWLWRLGSILLIGQPNEAYSSLQISMRAAFPDAAVAVMNLVNGSCGYLYPRTMAGMQAYAVWQSPFAAHSLEELTKSLRQAAEEVCRTSY